MWARWGAAEHCDAQTLWAFCQLNYWIGTRSCKRESAVWLCTTRETQVTNSSEWQAHSVCTQWVSQQMEAALISGATHNFKDLLRSWWRQEEIENCEVCSLSPHLQVYTGLQSWAEFMHIIPDSFAWMQKNYPADQREVVCLVPTNRCAGFSSSWCSLFLLGQWLFRGNTAP